MAPSVSTLPRPAVHTRRLRVAQFLVVLFHLTGFVGLAFSDNPEFYLRFTPLTLLLTAFLLFSFQLGRGVGFWSFCFTTIVLGYLVEWTGVATHQFFGHYTYGNALGPKLYGVPPLIGLNWLVLTYVTGTMVRQLPLRLLPRPVLRGLLAAPRALSIPLLNLLRIFLAAVLMVGLDLCMEPVASRYDFWHWTAKVIPLQNFRDWFIFSCVLQFFFTRAYFVKRNRLAPLVYLAQLLFFFLLGSLE
jgi:putative membrane protein